MPILPLPQFEADLEEDRLIYERLKPPTSIVVRFGAMKMVGEFPYEGDAKPGCGSKIVVRTHRGTELGEMLTSTCPNAGCSKSVTRKEMLEYIENSGGRDYPFFNQGRVLRIATVEDLNEQARLDGLRKDMLNIARQKVKEAGMGMKVADAEPILGQERITFYFTCEERVDFRDLVSRLAGEFHTRIELRQIGARDEARLTADYEKCGQHCCCKQFLKVLKPVSMKSAKVQKATLDPLKISGRCGRLMCCLRYEDQTYSELQKRLPKRKWRVQTEDGTGIVIDTQILTQLVLVRLDATDTDVAVPLEDLTVIGPPGPPPPQGAGSPGGVGGGGGGRPGMGPGGPRAGGAPPRDGGPRRPDRDRPRDTPPDQRPDQRPEQRPPPPPPAPPAAALANDPDDREEESLPEEPGGGENSGQGDGPGDGGGGADGGRRKRRRRRRRRDGGGPDGPPPTGGPAPGGPAPG